MKIEDVALRNGWKTWDVTEFARKYYGGYLSESFRGTFLDDSVIGRLEKDYKEHLVKEAEEKARRDEERVLRTVTNENMTTGYNFEGFRIVKYLGVVSGEAVMGSGALSSTAASISNFAGTSSESYRKKLTSAKNQARSALAHSAFELGANAVIGINYDVFDMNGLVGFSANGTAVVRERIEDD